DGQGTYAEFHVVDQALVARKPARLTHVEAAGTVLPLADIAQAHALLEGGTTSEGRRRPRGKIAIAVNSLDEPPRATTSLP
ncbi:hypothetical protein ACFWAJ_37005, partial [Streptomyces sp. NPDC059943]